MLSKLNIQKGQMHPVGPCEFQCLGRRNKADDRGVREKLTDQRELALEENALVVHQNDVRRLDGAVDCLQQEADVDIQGSGDPEQQNGVRNAPAGLPARKTGALHKQQLGKLLLG